MTSVTLAVTRSFARLPAACGEPIEISALRHIEGVAGKVPVSAHITVDSGTSPIEARYANYFEVRLTSREILIDFGQYYPDEFPPSCHTRLVVSADSGQVLREMLAQAIERQRAEQSETEEKK